MACHSCGKTISCELGGQSPKVRRNNLLASRQSNHLPLLVVASRKTKTTFNLCGMLPPQARQNSVQPIAAARENNPPVSWVVGFQKQGKIIFQQEQNFLTCACHCKQKNNQSVQPVMVTSKTKLQWPVRKEKNQPVKSVAAARKNL